MQTYTLRHAAPPTKRNEAAQLYCPTLYIKADLARMNYDDPVNKAPDLLKEWEEANDHPAPLMTRIYGSMFLFHAGMMYGIRKERARRKRAGMEARP